MKRICISMVALVLFAMSMVACGAPAGKCDPACGAGEVCYADDGKTYECKKSCTTNDDCTAPLVCHSDESPAHCGEED